MTQKTRWVVASLTLVGVLLGGVAGYFLPDLMVSLGFIGGLFVNGLRLLILPLIVAAVVAGVASLGQWRRTGGALGAGLLYFVVTTLVAAGIALALVSLVGPGLGIDKSAGFVPPELLQIGQPTADDLAGRFLPSSQLEAILSGNYFGLILFSLFFGLGLAALGSRQRVVVEFFRGVRDTMVRLVQLLLYAAPVGLFFVVGRAVAEADSFGPGYLGNLGAFLLVMFGALLIHGAIVLPLILKFYCGRSPLEFFGKFLPAFGTALGTGSSMTTMPVTWESVVDKNRVDSRAGALMIPLGSTINLDGSAIYTVVVAMFVAQVFGIDISVLQMLLILGATLLASIGTAGLPGASLLMAVMVFDMAGFPQYAYAGLGLVIAADWLVERGRAAVNVWSDAVGAAFVDKRMKSRAVAGVRPAGKPQRSVRRDSRPTRKSNGSFSRDDRRSTEGRPPGRERDSRRPDDRRQGRSRDRTDYKKREPQPTVHKSQSRPTGRPASDTQPSPFAMPTNSRSDFDPEATAPDVVRSTSRKSAPPSRPVSNHREDRSTSPTQSAGRKPTPPARSQQRSTRHVPRPTRDTRHHPEREKNQTRPAPSKEAPASTELTPGTIERERERVSAQLAALRKKEHQGRDKSEKPEKSSVQSDRPESSKSEEKIGTSFPHIDYYASEAVTEKKPTPAEEARSFESGDSSPADTTDDDVAKVVSSKVRDDDEEPARELTAVVGDSTEAPSGEETSESSATSYGRQRTRRGEKVKSSSDTPDTPTPAKPDSGDFEVTKQSFGRAKKKRIRR